MPDLMAPGQIHEQLQQLGFGQPMMVVECRAVGDNPAVDLVTTDSRISSREKGGFRNICTNIESQLANVLGMHFVLLCDITLPGIEPAPTVSWNIQQRRRATIFNAMSCYNALARRSPRLHRMLRENPDRLVIATIEEEKVLVHPTEGRDLIGFMMQAARLY